MPWWAILLLVLLVLMPIVLLLNWGFSKAIMSGKLYGDSAPGWMLECRSCKQWRPAGEAGMTRRYAAGKKLQLVRCTACNNKLRLALLTRGPGPSEQRTIDHRTNETIWPETMPPRASGTPTAAKP
ncbi:MAG: hypothetical protein AAGB48_02010 [Planctomycetota bacterium]